MSKQTLNAFNRNKISVSEQTYMKAEALNTVLFVDRTMEFVATKFSGGITTSEIEGLAVSASLKAKIKKALSQVDGQGNPLLPDAFYVAGYEADELVPANDLIAYESFLAFVTQGAEQRQACYTVFDGVLDAAWGTRAAEFDTIANKYNSYISYLVEDGADVTDTYENLNGIVFAYAHPTGEQTEDGSLAGRIIFAGAGNIDAEDRELFGETPIKESITPGDGGDLTVTEADALVAKGINLFRTSVQGRNGMSGMLMSNGKEFINSWELNRVRATLDSELARLRQETERLGMDPTSAGTVENTISGALASLSLRGKNPDELVKEKDRFLVDYRVTRITLSGTVENSTKYSYKVEVWLMGIAKSFEIGVVGYTDGSTSVTTA